MRIIHTSDWHLGQNFYTKSRASEHQAFLHWLLAQVEQYEVDAIIVAGDIFDTGSPPSYARELYNRFIVQLRNSGCALYLLAGNHDSVATLNESRELLACLNARVITGPDDDPFIIPRRDGAPGAILCPIPFLRARDMLQSKAGQSGAEKQRSLQDAIANQYQQSYARAQALRQEKPLPIVATGHLTTVGASASEAVRDIYIGTLDAFPAHAFPPADYIALGHIHRPQRVGGTEHIRYCGSPIALSFDETGTAKSVNLVEFRDGAFAGVTPLTVPTTQAMAVLKGTQEEIERQLDAWRGAPESPVTWLDIEIASDDWLHDTQRHIQRLTDSLPVEVLLIRRSRERRQRIIERQHQETLSELTPGEVFERRLAQETLDEEQKSGLRRLFQQTLDDVTQEHDA